MKGLFIPGITAEMFRNGCLESIEALMAEGEIFDVDYSSWIPTSEQLPMMGDTFLVTIEYKGEVIGVDAASYSPVEGYIDKHWDTFNDWKEDDDTCYHVTAWMPLPEGYKKEGGKMTLEEAIKRAEEVAEEQEKAAKEWHENQVRKCQLFRFAEMDYTHENECKKCAEEHRQLAEWLKELKSYRDDYDYKTLKIKLENAEDIIRGLQEDLRDARETQRGR